MQAAQTADYAITKFMDLDRLLLHHGRLSYVRLVSLIKYFMYKNLVFTFPIFLFGIYTSFTGTVRIICYITKITCY